MSRAYRIRVKEALSRVIRAHDQVSSQLEVIQVLPEEEMAELLARELEGQGFERNGGVMERQQGNITVSVELATGMVTVKAEATDEVDLEVERQGVAYDDEGPGAEAVRDQLSKQAKEGLERTAKEKEDDLQSQVTDELERQLADLRQELNQAINRATAEALKVKASRIGQIKEMTEDQEGGSLTIVVEV